MASVTLRLWQQILADVRRRDGDIVKPWFSSLEASQLENGVLEIRARSASHVRYLRQHATEPFTRSAQAVTGQQALMGAELIDLAQVIG